MENETNMTNLSPAAQAVMDAYVSEDRAGRLAVAATLRAAADQLSTTNGECPGVTIWESGFLAGAAGAQQALLVIAAELEGSL